MVAYDKATGAAGKLRINVTITQNLAANQSTFAVSYQVICSSSATFANGKTWSADAAGVDNSGTFNINGVQTVTLWSTSRTFTHDGNGNLAAKTFSMTMGATGTSGLGGPTSHSVALTAPRIPKVPGAPGQPTFSGTTPTSTTIAWTGAARGHANIDRYEYQYDDNSTFTSPITVNAGNVLTKTQNDLLPGTVYWVKVRAHSGDGYGPFSTSNSFTTASGAAPGVVVEPSLNGQAATITLTPPPGGVPTAYRVERRLLGSGVVTPITAPSSPVLVSGLNPGSVYEWRAIAIVGTYESPASAWQEVQQPNPNTNPGDYFDGSTTDREDINFTWFGTVNNSTSEAVGLHPTGWMTFEEGAAEMFTVTGAVHRATGGIGPLGGAHSARVVFFSDTETWGFRSGTAEVAPGLAEAIPDTSYAGSISLISPRSKRLAAILRFFDSGGALLEQIVGPETWVPASPTPQRLTVTGISPLGTVGMAIQIIDVENDWVPWQGGDAIVMDTAIISRGAYGIPYFDGATPDADGYVFSWEGTANASPSYREGAAVDSAIVDPNCPPLPSPPRPPVIENDCIEDVLEWHRAWALLPASAAPTWLDAVPITKLRTGAGAERQVRVRFYANPFSRSIDQVDVNSYCAEQILTYIPPNTTVTLDGITSNALAQPRGASPSNINHLLYGTNGEPALWPVLSCGSPYYITVDVPADSTPGNLTFDLEMVVQH